MAKQKAMEFSGRVDLTLLPLDVLARVSKALAILEAEAKGGHLVFNRAYLTPYVRRTRGRVAPADRKLQPLMVNVLKTIVAHREGEGLPVTALARMLTIPAGSASGTCYSLEKRGLVRQIGQRPKRWLPTEDGIARLSALDEPTLG